MSGRVEGTCLACGGKVSLANPDADRLREVERAADALAEALRPFLNRWGDCGCDTCQAVRDALSTYEKGKG